MYLLQLVHFLVLLVELVYGVMFMLGTAVYFYSGALLSQSKVFVSLLRSSVHYIMYSC